MDIESTDFQVINSVSYRIANVMKNFVSSELSFKHNSYLGFEQALKLCYVASVLPSSHFLLLLLLLQSMKLTYVQCLKDLI